MIVVKVIGKNNTFKDVNVKRHKVDSAFLWLIQNNPHYNDVKVDNSALCSLPENGVPFDISTVDADSDILSDEIPHPDQGPLNEEDVVYNKSTEISSFLPVVDIRSKRLKLFAWAMTIHKSQGLTLSKA